jgi:helix-turn-helix protein
MKLNGIILHKEIIEIFSELSDARHRERELIIEARKNPLCRNRQNFVAPSVERKYNRFLVPLPVRPAPIENDFCVWPIVPEHILETYLIDNDITRKEFAKKIGVVHQAVSHWIRKIRYPRPEIAKRIVLATNGQITLQDIYA